MKVGIVGLGKLGMPVAVAMDFRGHEVRGYDKNPDRMSRGAYPSLEDGLGDGRTFQDALATSGIQFTELKELVTESDIIFVAVETPHNPQYEGITRLPDERVDFNYLSLKYCIESIGLAMPENSNDKVLAVISTVLPGTMRREIIPTLHPKLHLVYNPFFIAMGTTIKDFLEPEFILQGSDNPEASSKLESFYKNTILRDAPVMKMNVESAELTKVFYNTFIGFKIALSNIAMEICEKIEGADVDEVMFALRNAKDRIVSPKYLSGGMGDSGACHPRDNIAMSWLARKINLSYDLFDSIMKTREAQADWLASMMIEKSDTLSLPICILGIAYKSGTNLITGSHALLVKNILNEKGHGVDIIDPIVYPDWPVRLKRAVYLIGNKEATYAGYHFPMGSVVIDPHRYIADQEGVTVIRLGEKN